MTLLNKIKEDQLSFRKSGEKEKAGTLTYLLGLLSQKKDASDQDVISLIQSTIKSTKTSLEKHDDPEVVAKALTTYQAEFTFLESYLPQFLGDDEVIDFFSNMALNGGKLTKGSMGKLNLYAKSQGKLVDNKVAAIILNSFL